MTEELGGSELPTGGSASLFKVKHCGTEFPYGLRVARPHTEFWPQGQIQPWASCVSSSEQPLGFIGGGACVRHKCRFFIGGHSTQALSPSVHDHHNGQRQLVRRREAPVGTE